VFLCVGIGLLMASMALPMLMAGQPAHQVTYSK
jgi:hypothetical protein